MRAFLAGLGTDAIRLYWHSLGDDESIDRRDRAAHFGIDTADGQPKLLGRLLAGGVAEVERVAALSRKLPAPAIVGSRPVLITGGAGFIGANLADRLAADGQQVLIYDALARPGVERNLRWLARRHPSRVSFVLGDLRDEVASADTAASASAVFHLAGQVAVTTSMVHPLADFDVNARGTLALLEALRQRNPTAPLIFASTNKVYGDLADIDLVRDGERYLPRQPEIRAHGVSEARPLCFHTPYGCSKGAADQYVLDYAHSFGLRTAVLRMSCIYGERQLGTEDQGWVAHFLLRAIAGEPVTIYGDGRQVRDILHVGDAVAAYLAAWASIDSIAGRAYNLGGGPANAISLLQLIAHIETLLGTPVEVAFDAWRPGDQRYFVADTSAICRDLALAPALDWRAGLTRLAEHFDAGQAVRAPLTEAAL
jgi:CDP-paratose 2-epimerase